MRFSTGAHVCRVSCLFLHKAKRGYEVFERKLALLLALQGESIWKGCRGGRRNHSEKDTSRTPEDKIQRLEAKINFLKFNSD